MANFDGLTLLLPFVSTASKHDARVRVVNRLLTQHGYMVTINRGGESPLDLAIWSADVGTIWAVIRDRIEEKEIQWAKTQMWEGKSRPLCILLVSTSGILPPRSEGVTNLRFCREKNPGLIAARITTLFTELAPKPKREDP